MCSSSALTLRAGVAAGYATASDIIAASGSPSPSTPLSPLALPPTPPTTIRPHAPAAGTAQVIGRTNREMTIASRWAELGILALILVGAISYATSCRVPLALLARGRPGLRKCAAHRRRELRTHSLRLMSRSVCILSSSYIIIFHPLARCQRGHLPPQPPRPTSPTGTDCLPFLVRLSSRRDQTELHASSQYVVLREDRPVR